MRVHALIPAAGKSTRMGRPKLTLPLGGRTVLEHVLMTLSEAGIAHVLVVAGPHVPEVAALAESAGASVLRLSEETAGMRETVEQGLDWLEKHWQPSAEDSFLLVPADHPALEVEVVRRLLAAAETSPEHSIIIPTHEGQRGHPTLIGWRHVLGIRAIPAGQGLNSYLRQQHDATRVVAVETPTILWDVDTPADLERLQRYWVQAQNITSPERERR